MTQIISSSQFSPGNAVNMAVALANAQVNTVAFDIVIILSHIVMGTWLSCFILEFTQSYKIA